MRKVKLIKSLNVEEVPLFDGQELRVYNYSPKVRQVGDDSFLNVPDDVKVKVIPISFKDENGIEDTYVAYTKEVEELIQIPFSAIDEARKAAQSLTAEALGRLDNLNRDYHKLQNRIKDANFLARLRYLFAGKL